MERLLALYDSDVFYSTRFMEYFKKKKDFPFDIAIFTKKESLEEYLSFHQIEILLIGDQDTFEDIPLGKVRHIYKLTGSPDKDMFQEHPTVFKYQEVKAVMSEVLADYSKQTKDVCKGKHSSLVRIVTVLSLIPSLEAYVFAMAVSTIMAELNKILLVTVNPLPVRILSAIDNESSYLSEFIYYLKENPNIITKMLTMLQHDGNLSILSGIAHGSDVLSLNNLDMQRWIEECKAHTDYHSVIFFMEGFTEAGQELIKLSDNVILTGKETPYEKAMHMVWAKQTELCGIDTKQDKFLKVRLSEEKELKQLPVSIAELSRTITWSNARQSIEYIDSIGV